MDTQTLQTFFSEWLGKSVEVEDASALDQCMDWAFKYCDDFLHIDHAAIRHEFAYQVYTAATDLTRQYFQLIPNTPEAIPQAGDLPIFDQTVGPAGHICVAKGTGDTNSFESVDQNWNGHNYVEAVTHSYNGCIGWLRPLTPPTPQPTDLQVCLQQHDTLVRELNQAKATIEIINNANSAKDTQIAKLDGEITGLESRLASSDQALKAKTDLADTLPALQEQLRQAENDRRLALDAQETQNRTIGQLRSQLAAGKPTGLLNRLLFLFGK